MTRLMDMMCRHWRLVTLVAWLILAASFLYTRLDAINAFVLSDTDDNLRMSQVRALLAGQDWFDLRQYRLNPPAGADIHWSRLVDLPIAALILALRPVAGGLMAEKIAVAGAPLLPLLVLMFALALAARRLIDRRAYPLVFITLFFAGSTSGMFMPMRIDHHGWQLALLAVSVAGIADPKRARGGATAGAAAALSLAIGLELLIYLAIIAASTVAFWLFDRSQARRMTSYAASLAGGSALAFLLFASQANRLAVCDALSPVWLSDALLGGALLVVLAWLSPRSPWSRLALAIAAAAAIAAFHFLAWPQCLSRLEGVSAEVDRLWLSQVREARPIYMHRWDIAVQILAIPFIGALGWSALLVAARKDPDRLRRTAAAAAPALAALALLFWQTRTGPAAQMLGTLGSAALIWVVLPIVHGARNPVLRTIGAPLLIAIGLGTAAPVFREFKPERKPSPAERNVARANRACTSLSGLRTVALQPKGTVFTFVDLGPRLITVTHHDAVTGPYHRNGEQIADVMKAFRGDSRQARRIIAKYRSDYLLICPDMSTSTIFRAQAKDGFYMQLERGAVPDWLEPVDLGEDSPFVMWRVKR